MATTDPNATAALIESLHAPWRATVGDCLTRWTRLDEDTRARAYLVIDEGQGGRQRTLNSAAIATLAATIS